ncbi:MAG: PD-(D/E)XK nuclease family protein [Erysipelotrichaceae bacterium]|jgi:hypothetical protein|nr:PD-(D/E)XK nuclease family protein [Erysipelotrichaceae bacterium]
MNLSSAKTIIAPHYLHYQIQSELLKDSPGIYGITVKSLEDYLADFHVFLPEALDTLLTLRERLKPLDSLLVLKDYRHSFAFLKEVLSLHNELVNLSIDPQSLPQKSDREKDLHQILVTIHDLPTRETILFETLKNIQDRDVLYICGFEKDPLIFKEIQNKGWKMVEFPLQEIQTFHYYRARNDWEELSGIADLILSKPQPFGEVLLTLCDASTLPVAKTVLNRKGIPFQTRNDRSPSRIVSRFIALMQFLEKPDCSGFMELLKQECFDGVDHLALMKYLRFMPLEVPALTRPLPEIPETFQKDNSREIRTLRYLREKAQAGLDQIHDWLITALKASSTRERIVKCDLLLQQSRLLSSNEAEAKVYLRLRELLDHYGERFETLEVTSQDLMLLLSNLECQNDEPKLGALTLTTLQETASLHGYKAVYLAGANSSCFPPFSKRSGIIDDYYLNRIPGYPDPGERYTFTLSQYRRIFSFAPMFCASYSSGALAGGVYEPALEIRSLAERFEIPHPKPFAIFNDPEPIRSEEIIGENLSQALFFKDGCLHTSFSALEKFLECPARYFYQYGLGLREYQLPQIDAILMGNLLHNFMEFWFSRPQSEAPDLATIQNYLIAQTRALHELMPSESNNLKLAIAELAESLYRAMETLYGFDKAEGAMMHQCEAAFEGSLLDKKLAFKARIDRLTQTQEGFYITDYKSSKHSLNESSIKRGETLQLPLYGLVAAHATQSLPTALAYFYLSPQFHYASCYTFKWSSKRSLQTMEPNLIEQVDETEFKQTTNNLAILELDEKLPLENMEAVLNDILSKILDRIKKGEFVISPLESACAFCEFKRLCAHRNLYRKPSYLSQLPLKIKKGENPDAL